MVNLTSHNVNELTKAKFWLVLIGINSYQDSQIPNLRYCAKDCKALAETLKIATAGFWQTEIIALYDEGEKSPNQSNILESIQIFRKAKPEDLVLFYFSGHGYLDNNRPTLCVADTNCANLAATGLKLDTLLGELRQCQAKRQLLWLDACQEQYQDKYHPNPTSQLLVILNEQAEQSQDFSAMLSCDKNERSWEIPELKHGLFTYCLIEGLKGKAANPEGQISADSLFYYVKDSSYKYIECKKNLARVNDVSKGIGGTLKKASNQLKVNRFSVNISQTPQTITRGGGGRDLLIGLAKQYNQRKALIIDQLFSSATQIKLCKILKTKGNFEVEYCYLQSQLEQKIASYLETNQQTFILYLAGTITLNKVGEYELKCGQNKLINLNWLGERLRTSPVEEIIVIADLVNENGQIEDLTNIFKPDQNKSLCLITSTTSESNQRKFLDQLINILTIAGALKKEFWLIELITQLQQWSQSQSDLNLRLWLSGSLEVREILTVEVQRSDNNVFTLNLCPYKSLQAFNQDDAYFFHGREELIREIINKFQSTDFLGVVGASGSGKSSVVKAGVIPQLLTQGLFSPTLNKYQFCQCWVIIPGNNPLGTLVKTLGINNSNLDSDSFSYWLKQQSQEISILVIDQFEELFTLTAEKDKKIFLKIILETIKKTRDYFRVIITLRSDFLDQCLRMSELAPLISKSQVLVPSCRLEDEQYRQMIVQPAQKVGLEVEEGLIALLLKELTEGSLPLLQYALEKLWQKRSQGKLTLQDYQKHIGKLGKFLSNKAQETYDKLNEHEKECAQFIFLSLVFLAKNKEELNKETRNRVTLYTLQIDKYKNVLDSTLKALIKARLVVVNREENNLATQEQEKITVEIAHEIILQDWETLKEWLDIDRQKYRFIKEIEHKADEWKVNGKQDDFLLSKGALAKYEEFYLNHANYLGPNSQELINASIRARKRRKLLLRGSVTGFIVLISMALIATLW